MHLFTGFAMDETNSGNDIVCLAPAIVGVTIPLPGLGGTGGHSIRDSFEFDDLRIERI
jgi:hypothetical protein